mmetsp:Transcript_27838/g.51940  ORF Transcript_27838/g.51940 Transcript_27838/m.51940 type:complete len:420 (-) Transcript_27838:1989-3248(-)
MQVEIPAQMASNGCPQLFGVTRTAHRFQLGLAAQDLFDLCRRNFDGPAGQSQAAHGVFQLAHIARPAVSAENLCRGVGQNAWCLAAFVTAQQEMIRKQRNVVDPLAQRWHIQRGPRQPVIEVLANHPRLHRCRQIGLARGQKARHIFAGRVHHPHDAGLKLFGDIANLVDQKRASLDPGQQTRRPLKVLQISSTRGDKRQRAPVRKVVDGPRNQRFARPAFPPDQHRQVGVHHPRNNAVERLHDGRPPDQRQLIGAFIFGSARGAVGLHLQRFGGALHQVRQVKGLGQIVIGLGLGRLNGRHDRILGRNNNDRQSGPVLRNLWQHLQPIAIRHHHVRDHHVALALTDPAHQRGQAGGRMHLAARPGQRLGQNGANCAVIIGDKYSTIHRLILLRLGGHGRARCARERKAKHGSAGHGGD